MFLDWLRLRWDYRNLDRFSNSEAFTPIRRWRKYKNYRFDHKLAKKYRGLREAD